MEIGVSELIFEDIYMNQRGGEKIRGCLGNRYKEIDLLHNHNKDKYIYRYPLIQYKIIDKKPLVIGINEGGNVVENIALNDDNILLNEYDIVAFEKKIVKKRYDFEATDNFIEYEFLTPWLALSQKNVNRYLNGDDEEKKKILSSILIGNIISMSKGLDYTVDKQLKCDFDLKSKIVKLKGVKNIGFVGGFKVNFKIPDYFGIGKSVSKGLGIVKVKS